jgi:hypothetical protein
MYKLLAVYIMANQPDWKRLPLYDFATCIFYDPYHVDLAVATDETNTHAVKKAFYLNKREEKIGEIEKGIEEAYHDNLTPREEAMSILYSLQTEYGKRKPARRSIAIDDSENNSSVNRMSNSSHSYPLLHELVALNPDGTLAPLSLLQRIYYGSAFNKLVHKLERVHLESDQLESLLGQYDLLNIRDKEYTLLQHFVLTNCSDTSRLVVSKLMFTRSDTIPAKIEPLSWCFAVVFLFGSILYFLYFIFMWGVQNHGLTLQNWCINAAVSFGQDVFISEPIMIICIFIILFGKSKKEMRAIYHALNAVLVKYSTMSAGASDKTQANRRISIAPKRTSMATRRMSTVTSESTENTAVSVPQSTLLSSIIQRLCPACRVARTETAKYLSFAQILRCVKDEDMQSCRMLRKSNSIDGFMGTFIIACVLLGLYCGQEFNDLLVSMAIPTIIGGICSVFSVIFSFNFDVFAGVLTVVAFFLTLRYLIIGPALKRGKVLLERAKQAEQVSYHDEMHSKVNSGGHRSHLHIDTRHPTELPERSQEYGEYLKWNTSLRSKESQPTDLMFVLCRYYDRFVLTIVSYYESLVGPLVQSPEEIAKKKHDKKSKICY